MNYDRDLELPWDISITEYAPEGNVEMIFGTNRLGHGPECPTSEIFSYKDNEGLVLPLNWIAV